MIALDPGSAVVPFEQIRSQLADLIRSGGLAGGQRLPSIRQLAADLRVAPGTVAKAYTMLESDDLIESSRTRGTRVALGKVHAEEVQRAAKTFVDAVGGLDLEQALGAVRAAWLAIPPASDARDGVLDF
ncbi:GntR family transcriptional regulator [Microbacterium ulmi]|uniref:GntR family transcriptional regulator n=1 Tax=Microbacterium ulmi TaxID=179095 RepID=A0A7Y2PY44_9MICO|nr:DNA-binding transcriptional regulator YhcF (GntR family) [Microbacterium ulmi]NNH02921.1 GntR family transcriptional regulator [Microbacterium ulmi]